MGEVGKRQFLMLSPETHYAEIYSVKQLVDEVCDNIKQRMTIPVFEEDDLYESKFVERNDKEEWVFSFDLYSVFVYLAGKHWLEYCNNNVPGILIGAGVIGENENVDTESDRFRIKFPAKKEAMKFIKRLNTYLQMVYSKVQEIDDSKVDAITNIKIGRDKTDAKRKK
jgi:hypothetical protein